ncbi:MAG: PepSY domain-containing protein [Thermus sp.]|uniref:PepSY domain-containing protein n=1 Tax=Thermus sp. TaxID=275 RepID=UPI003919351E
MHLPRVPLWPKALAGAVRKTLRTPLLLASLLLLGAAAAKPPLPELRVPLEDAVLLTQAYLRQPLEPYKVALKHKPREALWVWEVRLGTFEVWVEAQRGQVVYVRIRGLPPHAAQPHLPLARILPLAREKVGRVERLELKPKPKEGLLVWEAKGHGREVWFDARTGRVLYHRGG